ncbi:hypothetical protein, partial [Donghicola sp. XS_ASV15]|uniref:hypothetical protein n=1 Tax=Donghicola sp. XS_ASV15 TaxID=3241295 RepID=UPI003518B5AE
VMLFVAYRFISNINAMGEVDDKKEPDKQTVVKSKKIPVQQKLEAKKVIYTDVVNHPLDKLCTSYEYAKGNLVDVRHFINCVIGNQKEEKKIVLTNDDGSEDQQTVVEPKIKLLSQNYLKHLGYKIYLLDDTPVLKFANQEFYLHQF